MSDNHWSDFLCDVGACSPALEWARTQPDAATAWETCHRADWLLWIAARLSEPESAERKAVALAACACARTALELIPSSETRPRVCLETVEAWAKGEIPLLQVHLARRGAWEARTSLFYAYCTGPAADGAASYDIANAIASTADVALAHGAYTAAVAANHVADCVSTANGIDGHGGEADRTASRKSQAVIVRGMLPMPQEIDDHANAR